jgi:peptide/nickel transport system permease protein
MSPLPKYVFKRLLLVSVVIIVVLTITFTLSHIIPGDPARLYAGPHAPAEEIQRARVELGLDKPIWEQYVLYWIGLLSGNLGMSIHTRRPVIQDLMDYFPATVELTTVAMTITVILGVVLGIISALHRDEASDHASRLFALAGVAMPVFWLGILAQIFLGYILGLFPISGRIDPMIALVYPTSRITGLLLVDSLIEGNMPAFLSALSHIVLPALTDAFATLAIVSRMVRAQMLEVLDKDYVRTAKSLGLPNRLVTYKYALKNALIPVITVIGLSYGYSLSGVFLVETVFDWPGLGRYATDSIVTLDYPAIMGVVILTGLVYVLVNLVVDVLYAYLNPKIRY